MNKILVRSSILALAALTLPAQTNPIVKTTVPFEFTVMGRTMPPGDYVVAQSNNSAAVILKCRDRSVSVIVPTDAVHSAVPQDTGKLIFHRYGGQYFLSEVWSSGSDGRKLHTTKQERELALRYSPDRAVVASTR